MWPGLATFSWLDQAPRGKRLEALVALDRLCLPGEAWVAPQWRDFFERSLKLALLVEGGWPQGYLALLPLGGGEAEILKLGIDPDWRRQGWGRQLMEYAFAQLGPARLVLELRASNRAAQQMYLSFGFAPVGRRKDYYDAPLEDALVYIKEA
ncbi:MAG: GNAT family N-acetyltransferase [bacterium]|nr:GNAT family N-acetyltransferase [bacterium]